MKHPLTLLTALLLAPLAALHASDPKPAPSAMKDPASAATMKSESEDWALGPFVKYGKLILEPSRESVFLCPILGRKVRWEAQNVYNPAAVVKDGKVWLLYRADDEPRRYGNAGKWDRTCRIGLAVSSDGRNFTRYPEPVLFPDNDACKQYEWEGGVEDIHIVEDEAGTYYVNYTAYDGTKDVLCVASSKDLLHWTKHGPAFEHEARGNRFHVGPTFGKGWEGKTVGGRTGAVVCRREGERLIAARINGKYWMYWRGGTFLATSRDLIKWEPVLDADGRLVSCLPKRPGRFDSGICEAGAIALLTDLGIVLSYNALNDKQGGDPAYPAGWSGLGQALFAAADPARLLARQQKPYLHAEHEWELHGFASPAVVANGMVSFRGEWLLYYGAADRCMSLAVSRPSP